MYEYPRRPSIINPQTFYRFLTRKWVDYPLFMHDFEPIFFSELALSLKIRRNTTYPYCNGNHECSFSFVLLDFLGTLLVKHGTGGQHGILLLESGHECKGDR